jgi:AcrR family transcriptional regulator
MVRPKRTTPVDLPVKIKEVARRQMAERGSSALSLRAIARELGVTAPAIYNYFPNRDALVTALIVDAFTSFGEALQASLESFSPGDHQARLSALGLAYREWAITHSELYQLIFGTPIPSYHAPAEITQPAAAQSLGVLIGVLAAAFTDGRLRVDQPGPITPRAKKMLKTWQSDRGGSDVRVLFLAMVIVSQVHGLVSFEIGNQYPPFVVDAGELYKCEIDHLIHSYLGG